MTLPGSHVDQAVVVLRPALTRLKYPGTNKTFGPSWRRRGYVVLKPGAPDSFILNDPVAAKVCKAS